MSTDKHLDNLFESARQAEPLVSEEEIALQLQVKGSHTPKHSNLLNLKTVLFMSTLFVAIISAFYFWMPADEAQTNTLPVAKSDTHIDESLIKAPDPTTPSITNFYQKQIATATSATEPVAPVNGDRMLFPSAQQPVYRQQMTADAEQLPFLELDYEALKSLHIYTDGNTLMYMNVKDTSLFGKKKIFEVGNHLYFTIGYDGGGGTYSNNDETGKNADRLLDIRPVVVERIVTYVKEKKPSGTKPGDEETLVSGAAGDACFRQDYIDLVKTKFVPVKLRLTAKESKYGRTDHDVIFWFEPTTEFLKVLPANVPSWLVPAVAAYNQQAFNDKVRQLQNQKKQAKNNLEPNVMIDGKAVNNLRSFSNEELGRLGFIVDGKTMRYENKYAEGKYLRIYATNGWGHATYYQKSSSVIKRIRYTSLPFRPLFCTGSFYGAIQLIPRDVEMPADLEKYNQSEQALMLFSRMKDKLVPVEVKLPNAQGQPLREVYWFEPTPEFLAALPQKPEQHTHADLPDRSINMDQVKLVELTADELLKLGVKVSDKRIAVTDNRDGKPFTIWYSKHGTEMKLQVKPGIGKVPVDSFPGLANSTSTQPSPSNIQISINAGPDQAVRFNKKVAAENARLPSATLITDDLGQMWRSYNINDVMTEEELGKMMKNELSKEEQSTIEKRRRAAEIELAGRLGGFIPVLVRSGDVNAPDRDSNTWRADIIIWYEPTEALFDALPTRIANDLRNEYQHIFVKKDAAPTCNYFEACKNSPGAVSAYSAYPNPTDDELELVFTLNDLRIMKAIIYTIGGSAVKLVFMNESYNKGTHAYKMHINDLAPGMYLLILESDKGDKVSQRIIRK